ncbi:MAG: NERD domain-containing protein, partial [Acidimicrobiaceae bacterium]|nr:NERD domain-containing protein [Acidimicrobiaceae bacterium]
FSESVQALSSQADEAGASAMKKYEYLHEKRDLALVKRWGRLAPIARALTSDPITTRVWAQGAVGEEVLGRQLSDDFSGKYIVLHDRRIKGTRANIDHMVLASSGIWIIDAKRYTGVVERRRARDGSKKQHLFIDGRDRHKLVDGMAFQLDRVKKVTEDFADLPLFGVLCFVETSWWSQLPLELEGVLMTRYKWLKPRIESGSILEDQQLLKIGQRINDSFPPAARGSKSNI